MNKIPLAPLTKLLLKPVLSKLVSQSLFYHEMTTATPRKTPDNLFSTSSDSSSSSSDSSSDSNDDSEQTNFATSPASPTPQDQPIPAHHWYKPRLITFTKTIKYPVERNSDDPRKRKESTRQPRPLVSSPTLIPLNPYLLSPALVSASSLTSSGKLSSDSVSSAGPSILGASSVTVLLVVSSVVSSPSSQDVGVWSWSPSVSHDRDVVSIV